MLRASSGNKACKDRLSANTEQEQPFLGACDASVATPRSAARAATLHLRLTKNLVVRVGVELGVTFLPPVHARVPVQHLVNLLRPTLR